jgi:hypothetical protein
MCTATRSPMRTISLVNLNQVGHLTREFSRGS